MYSFLQNRRSFIDTYSIIILGVISILSSTSLFSQGYHGKRLGIGLDVATNMGINLENDFFIYKTIDPSGELVDADIPLKDFYINLRPSINLEYILNRKNSIQFAYSFFSKVSDITGFQLNNKTYYPNDRSRINNQAFGIKYRHWRRDGLSPLGKYISFGADLVTSNIIVNDQQFQSKFGLTVTPTVTNSTMFIPKLGFGAQHGLSQKIVFNFGIEMGVIPPNFWRTTSINLDSPQLSITDWAKENNKFHRSRWYVINVILGVSIF